MRAERVGSDTLLAQIVRMVGEAQRTRAPIQRLADAIAGWFVPAVVVVAVLAFVAWALGARAAAGARAPERGRGADHRVPVRARPGDADGDHGRHGRGASAGVLIKNAEALERLEKVDTLVVDKTGTLTEGKPRLVARRCRRAVHRDEDVLRAGGGLEQASEHPLAAAIVAAARERRRRDSRGRPIRVADRAEASTGTVEGRRVAPRQRIAARRARHRRGALRAASRAARGARARP